MPKVSQEHGDMLDATKCKRCKEPLDVRTYSFFTKQVIGRKCMDEEEAIKERLGAKGLNVERYRDCGYIPDPVTEPATLKKKKGRKH